eukprot:3319281-Heterocapsa_arctica.AAC.1
MAAIADDQIRELEPNRPEDFNLQQDITHEVPANPSSMLDPATWTKLVAGPPAYAWGGPADLPTTAGGRPNGAAVTSGQAQRACRGSNNYGGCNRGIQFGSAGDEQPDGAPEQPHHPADHSSMDSARQL